jgi:Uma2 family endonuclease
MEVSMVTAGKTTQITPGTSILNWQSATWEDYLRYRDDPDPKIYRLFFNGNYLFVDMGNEGINHASINSLVTMLFAFWFTRFPEQTASDLGGVLLEKPNTQAASPDRVLYIGEGVPQWKPGESRYINLNQWRVPDLVCEVGDTTLSSDLDEQKKLYAALGVPEYWVIDVRGKRVFAFGLQSDGTYKLFTESVALKGLPISLLDQTLERLDEGTNISAASWFNQAIANLNQKS